MSQAALCIPGAGGIFEPAEPFGQPLAFVDLETTGATAASDRITEIGIIEVDGGRIVEEWSTLVNPESRIPAYIETLTGITNEMVEDAPTFAQIYRDVFRRLEGKLFIAHNVRFDHGFLRHEFKRLDVRFAPRVLCTVKLSRRLFPEHRRHNLDSLMERHGLACSARHRALGDAQVLWQFIDRVAQAFDPGEIRAAVEVQLQTPTLPPGLRQEDLDDVPDGPGVYLFYDAKDAPLYVGRSAELRSRVMAHFTGDRRPAKDARIAQQVARVSWIQSAGELGARLQEAKLVKELLPVHNRQSRPVAEMKAFRWRVEDAARTLPSLISGGDIEPACFEHIFGLFRSRRKAQDALREIAGAHRLCPVLLGLETQVVRGSACPDHELNKCAGACCGKETLAAHNLRLLSALTRMKLRPWPFRGRIGIREHADFGNFNEMHVFDQWCWLGTAHDERELEEIAARRGTPAFDLDVYHILVRHLARKAGKMDVVTL
jgi:DNA polymerase-3 subunit epsilon